jgi:ElaB/YqjD/DUF883 family membrane-anchored ribosome-binding protein
MATDTLELVTEQANAAGKSATEAVDHGRQALNEAIIAAEKVFVEGAKRADKLFRESERTLKDNVERFREQAKVYGETAGQSVDEAQRYVVERVKERPVTATLVGLGIGLLVGVVLSGRNK